MAFSCLFLCLGNRLIVPNAFSRFGSFVLCRQLVDYCRACRADDLVLGIRASRTTDCSDNYPLLDQRYAASRRNDSIECEQVIEMHELDTVFEYLGWAPEGRGSACLVLGNLHGVEHGTVHALQCADVAARIEHRYVHLPIPSLRLCHRRVNNPLDSV